MDMSLHQIDLPRNWPSGDETGAPLRYVYHSCRTELKDLKHTKHKIEDIDRGAKNIAWLRQIAAAVADGRRYPSPFFHMSRAAHGPHHFAELAQRDRGEKPGDQIFTESDLLAMYQDGVINDHHPIDISSRPATAGIMNLFEVQA